MTDSDSRAVNLPCVWDAPRPYVHPLTTPAGGVLSVEAPADHPWHHALWFTIKFVNGENFWEEYDEFGTLRTVAVTEPAPGTTRADLEWIAPDGESVRLRESRTLRAEPVDAESYLIDWTEELAVPVETVLDRTPFTTWGGYGGLTLRGAPTWTDTVITLDDGVTRDRTLGERSRWLSIEGLAVPASSDPSRSAAEASSSGASSSPSASTRPSGGAEETETGATSGVVMLDHPDNVRTPSPFYASTRADTYGEGWANFVNAAFLWDEPLTIGPSEPLTLRYRVLVHDGAWPVERIEAEYTRWTG